MYWNLDVLGFPTCSFPERAAFPERGAFPERAAFLERGAFPERAAFPERGAFPERAAFPERGAYPEPAAFPERVAFPEPLRGSPPSLSVGTTARVHRPPDVTYVRRYIIDIRYIRYIIDIRTILRRDLLYYVVRDLTKLISCVSVLVGRSRQLNISQSALSMHDPVQLRQPEPQHRAVERCRRLRESAPLRERGDGGAVAGGPNANHLGRATPAAAITVWTARFTPWVG